MFVIRNHRMGSIYALANTPNRVPHCLCCHPVESGTTAGRTARGCGLVPKVWRQVPCSLREGTATGGPSLSPAPRSPRPHLAFPFGVSSGRGLLRGQDEELRCEPGLRGQVQRVLETDWRAGQGDPEGDLGDPEEVKPAA